MMIKTIKPCNRGGVVSLRKRLQRRVEVRGETKLEGNATKLDDFAANGERSEELGALQRLSLVRQCDQTLVDASFPIGRQLFDISPCQSTEIAQGKPQQPLDPEFRRERW